MKAFSFKSNELKDASWVSEISHIIDFSSNLQALHPRIKRIFWAEPNSFFM